MAKKNSSIDGALCMAARANLPNQLYIGGLTSWLPLLQY